MDHSRACSPRRASRGIRKPLASLSPNRLHNKSPRRRATDNLKPSKPGKGLQQENLSAEAPSTTFAEAPGAQASDYVPQSATSQASLTLSGVSGFLLSESSAHATPEQFTASSRSSIASQLLLEDASRCMESVAHYPDAAGKGPQGNGVATQDETDTPKSVACKDDKQALVARVAELEEENQMLRVALREAGSDVEIAQAELISTLKREIESVRAESEKELGDAKYELWACEALVATLRRDLAAAEAAKQEAPQLARQPTPPPSGDVVPHAASEDSSGTTQPEEWREVDGDTAALVINDSRFGHGSFKIQKKVLWDVHKLQRENAALLENMQKQCEHRERLQEQVAALRAKTKALEGMEEQLSSLKAENFSLACQHRAGLQRLEEVLAEDSRLRVQLEDRCVVIRRLEAVCLELEASSLSAKQPHHAALDDAIPPVERMVQKLRGFASAVESQTKMDTGPVVERVISELGRCEALDGTDSARSGQAATLGPEQQERGMETGNLAHASEVKLLRKELAQTQVWLDEALSRAEGMRCKMEALRVAGASDSRASGVSNELANMNQKLHAQLVGVISAQESQESAHRMQAILQEQVAVTRKQDELLQDGKLRLQELEGALQAANVEVDAKSQMVHDLRSKNGEVREELAKCTAALRTEESTRRQLAGELECLKDELEERRTQLKTLTSQKLAEDVELSRAREQLEVQSAKVQSLERVRARVESELATLKADYQHSASEASQLKLRHGEHRDRATALEAEARGLRARLSALGAELDEATKHKSRLEVENRRLTVRVEQLEHDISEVRAELKSERSMAETANQSLQKMAKSQSELEAELRRATEQADAVREEAGRWNQQAATVYTEAAVKEREHEALQAELEAAREQCRLSAEEAQGAEKQLNEVLHALAEARLAKEDAESELGRANEALRLAKVDAARWEEQAQQSVRAVSDVQSLREEAVKLEAQVAALEANREAGEAALAQARADVQVVARVRQEALRWEEMTTKANRQVEALEESKGVLQHDLNKTREELHRACEAAQSWELKARDWETKATVSASGLEQVSEAKDLLEASVQHARMDAARLERESSSLAEQAKEERAHAQMLASKVELSKREMAKVYQQLEESLKSQGALQGQLESMEGQVAQMTACVSRLEDTNTRLHHDLNACRQERVDGISAFNELQRKEAEASRVLTSVRLQLERAQLETASVRDQLATATQKHASDSEHANTLAGRLQDAERRAQQACTRADATAAAWNELKATQAGLEAKVKRGEEEVRACQEAVRSWRERASKDRARIQALDQATAEQRAAASQMQEQLAKVDADRRHRERLEELESARKAACTVTATEHEGALARVHALQSQVEFLQSAKNAAVERAEEAIQRVKMQEQDLQQFTSEKQVADENQRQLETHVRTLSAAVDEAKRLLSEEQGARKQLAADVTQTQRIVQLLCSENEELKARVQEGADHPHGARLSQRPLHTPWTDHFRKTAGGVSFTPISPTPISADHSAGPHPALSLSESTPGRSLQSLQSGLLANQRLIALIEQRMHIPEHSPALTQPPSSRRQPGAPDVHPYSQHVSNTEGPSSPTSRELAEKYSVAERKVMVQRRPSTCLPPQASLAITNHEILSHVSAFGSANRMVADEAEMSLDISPIPKTSSSNADEEFRSSFGSIPGNLQLTASRTALLHQQDISEETVGASDDTEDSGNVLSGQHDPSTADTNVPLSVNTAVSKAKKYKSHAKLLHTKLQEQAALYQRVCTVYEEELQKARANSSKQALPMLQVCSSTKKPA